MSKEVLSHLLERARVDDELSLMMLQRALQRHGVSADEAALNVRILDHLLSRARVDDAASLRLLCQELIALGYGPSMSSQGGGAQLEADVMVIKPLVQSKLSGNGVAFVWALDRVCETVD